VILGVVAACVYAAILADVLARTRAPEKLATGVLGGLGAVFLAVALTRGSAGLVAWPVALLGSAYAVTLVGAGGVDDAAALVGVGLLVCGELTAWSIDERLAIPVEGAVVAARGLALGGLALASLGASALVVGLAAAPAGSGLAWTIVGAGSAVAVVWAAVALARRG
jgi:hypothetical protein